MTYAQVALPLPLKDLFDYAIPKHWENSLEIGMRVRVPFGPRTMMGVCVKLQENTSVPTKKIKSILQVLDPSPVIDEKMLDFAKWMANYYFCSFGEALEAIVPSNLSQKSQEKTISLLKLTSLVEAQEYMEKVEQKYSAQARILRLLQECDGQMTSREVQNRLQISASPVQTLLRKGILSEIKKEIRPDPFSHLPIIPFSPPILTKEQDFVLKNVIRLIETKIFQTVLLHGVTGSGKTEIYIKAIEHVIQQGKEAIVLVPEIALTPQTVTRFRQRFSQVAILHSELTPMQRSYQWQKINKGEIEVVIGPRSALFAPTHRLGLIIVDEEHEPSFKQQTTPRYHGRDMAIKRAQINNALVILGSATPSLESYYNAHQNRYHLFSLPQRVGKAVTPKIQILDMREECIEQKRFVYFSRILLIELAKILRKKEQAILFLNRRGFATTITCPSCGYSAKCDQCDISLTYHKKSDTSLCHYCNNEYEAPQVCPICRFHGIRYNGIGTQRAEQMLQRLFPEARIARMDSDTMIGRNQYEKILSSFERKEVDFLLGTQMIAKGLDFPSVTLVGIISADTSLQIPDFRAAERTFQLVVQVAGRSGRGEKPGKVILQTYHPDHYAIQSALKQDYEGFIHQEMSMRADLGYPPLGRLMRVVIEGEKEEKVKEHSLKIAEQLKQVRDQANGSVLGPTAAPLSMVKNRYRYHLIIKFPEFRDREVYLKALGPFINASSAIKVILDIDPVSLM